MRVLVYGAGSIGCLYAGRLAASGADVSILARGTRAAELREHAIHLDNAETGERSTASVEVVETLGAEDAYDLVLVALPRDHVAEVLPLLAKSTGTPNVMFFGNNAAGSGAMTDALGGARVLLGFPGAAALADDGHGVRYVITAAREQPTTIGELDGVRSTRIEAIAKALKAAGFHVSICRNMDAWLKTHVVEISPTANALYMAGGDAARLARTRDALVLMLRGIREGYRVLSAHGVPITPGNHRLFQFLPEPLLVAIMRRALTSDTASLKIGHALDARHEMKAIADELRAMAAARSITTPAMDRLYEFVDPLVEPISDGSADLPLRWGGVGTVGAVAATVISVIWWWMAGP